MIARLKLWAAGLGLVVAALAASWFGGRQAAKTDAKRKELEGYVKTRKRMDQVDIDDAGNADRWLHERANRRNL